MNEDREIHGIVIQQPLPISINRHHVFLALNPDKDVDGFTPSNMAKLSLGNLESCLIPSVAKAVVRILNEIFPDLTGKRVMVLGRSSQVVSLSN